MKTLIIPDEVEQCIAIDRSSVDTVFVDFEVLGKKERQKKISAHFSKLSIRDFPEIRAAVSNTELLARINPIGDHTKEEVNFLINNHCDRIMLPMFRDRSEVLQLQKIVENRIPVTYLVETKDALINFESFSDLFRLDDRVHFGLNDLGLEFGNPFLFDLLRSRTLDGICSYCLKRKIEFGIGGVGHGSSSAIEPELILGDYLRLGSEWVILSRSFKDNIEWNSLDPAVQEIDRRISKLIGFENSYLISNSSERSEQRRNFVSKVKCVSDELKAARK
jgi:hypothetical protein